MKKISSANVCSALGKVKSSEINFTSKLPLLWESFSRADGEDEGEVPFGIKIIFSSAHEKLFLYQFIIFCFVCCCRDDFEIKKSPGACLPMMADLLSSKSTFSTQN